MIFAVTVALASKATAQQVSQLSAAYPIVADTVDEITVDEGVEEEVEGASYDLRVTAAAPRPDPARKGFDIVQVTVTNAGTDASPKGRLAVNVAPPSTARQAAKMRRVGGTVIPSIPPGGHVTLRVQVPRSRDRRICYEGVIEQIGD